MAPDPFVLNVSDLLGNEASSRRVAITETVNWKVEMIEVSQDEPLRADLMLHPVSGGVAVTGRVYFATLESCYRCLSVTVTDRDTSVGALFDSGESDDETYPLDGYEINVAQMLRDDVLLSLPIVEVCGRDCPGVASSAQSGLNTELSDSDGDTHLPFAVLKNLLESEK